jgi:hypothetical protein
MNCCSRFLITNSRKYCLLGQLHDNFIACLIKKLTKLSACVGCIYVCVYLKVKQSLYRAGQTLWTPGGGGSQNCRQSAHAVGKVGNPKNRPPLSLRTYPWYSFPLEAESTAGAIVRPEGLSQWPYRERNPRPSGL